MNKMKEVAELLGVQLGEKFKLKGSNYSYYFTEDGLYSWKNDYICPSTMAEILNGEIEIEKTILDEKEKKYLENVIRPFKNEVDFIMVCDSGIYIGKCFLYIEFKESLNMNFPYFKKRTMYRGMEIGKKYSLEELGLFEDE